MKINPNLKPSDAPGAIKTKDVQLYIGEGGPKLKLVDKPTGASFTVAYLKMEPGNPLQTELSQDFAALAVAAPKLLASLRSILDGGIADPAEVAKAHEAIALATREIETPGVIGDALAAKLASL